MSCFPFPFVAVAALAASSLLAQDPGPRVEPKSALRFAPAVGTVSHCTLLSEVNAKHDGFGTVDAKLSLHCECTVEAATDGVVTLRFRFLRVVGSQSSKKPDGVKQEASYDSDTDKDEPPVQFPNVAGDTMVCKVDARGGIVDVEAPEGMTPPSYAPFALNGDAVSFLRLFAVALPEEDVAAGDEWSPKWTVGEEGVEPFVFAAASKLVAVAAGKATVEETATCDAPPVLSGFLRVESAVAKAKADVDVTAGTVLALKREVKLSGTADDDQSKFAMTCRWSVQAAAAPAPTKEGAKPKAPAPGGGG